MSIRWIWVYQFVNLPNWYWSTIWSPANPCRLTWLDEWFWFSPQRDWSSWYWRFWFSIEDFDSRLVLDACWVARVNYSLEKIWKNLEIFFVNSDFWSIFHPSLILWKTLLSFLSSLKALLTLTLEWSGVLKNLVTLSTGKYYGRAIVLFVSSCKEIDSGQSQKSGNSPWFLKFFLSLIFFN